MASRASGPCRRNSVIGVTPHYKSRFLSFQDKVERGERRKRDPRTGGLAMRAFGFCDYLPHIAPPAAAIDFSIGIENFEPNSPSWQRKNIILARDRREIADDRNRS